MTGTATPEQRLRAKWSTSTEPRWALEARIAAYRRLVGQPLPARDGSSATADLDRIVEARLTADEGGDAASASGADGDATDRRELRALERQGVVFTDLATALREHPDHLEAHFDQIAPANDDPYADLNTALWSGGWFLYVPPGVEVTLPLQARSRVHGLRPGPFERTLLVAAEGSRVHYVDGCSAPVYTADPLHVPVVEVVVGPGAHVTCTTIQNWSSNVSSVATRRARVEAGGHLTWVDATIGGRDTIAHPAVWLAGPKATGDVFSVAYAGAGQQQNIGATIVHAAPETTSRVVAKLVARDGGAATHRALVRLDGEARGWRSDVRGDALLLDDDSLAVVDPQIDDGGSEVEINVETTFPKVVDEQIFYLMSRGLSREEALGVIVNGFIEPVVRALPLAYAVELSRLVELQLEGGVG